MTGFRSAGLLSQKGYEFFLQQSDFRTQEHPARAYVRQGNVIFAQVCHRVSGQHKDSAG